jgi:FAD/FMN-containing dehydrogenase
MQAVHTITFGMAADHLILAEVVLADGTPATFEPVSLKEAQNRSSRNNNSICFYRAALHIRTDYANAIQQNWPATWRRASGYNLNYLLPWSSIQPPQWSVVSRQWSNVNDRWDIPEVIKASLPYPPIQTGSVNLAPLLAGSEGTLAVIRRAKVRLVPLPHHSILAILAYPSQSAACDAVPRLLELNPSAIELIPESLIRLARSVPAYAHQLTLLDPWSAYDGKSLKGSKRISSSLLVLEFTGDDYTSCVSEFSRFES